MEYQVVEEISGYKLTKAVNNQLRNGWKIQGGVSTTVSRGGLYTYVQAMTKIN